MPAFLASLLPLLLRLGGGFGAQKLAQVGGQRLASTVLPGVLGRGTSLVQGAGRALQSGPGSLGAFFAGDMATGEILDRLTGGTQPQTDEDGLTRLLSGQSGQVGESAFDEQVRQRQLRGTLMQALERSGIDLNQLQGVL